MERLCETDFTVGRVNAHVQYWHDGESFVQYMTTPRSEYGIMLLNGCEARFVLNDGEEVFGRRGEVVFLPKRAQYTVSFSQCDEETVRCLLINFQLWDERGQEFDLGPLGVLSFLRPFEVAEPIRQAVELYRAARYYPGAVKGALYSLLVDISDKKARRRRVPACFEGVERGRAYLERHWSEEVSLAALARDCLMSESGFRKRFREYTGCSPSEYRLNLRIAQAKRLLRSESVSVSDVALAVGIEDVNYFSRLFRRKTGQSPTAYMRGDLC